MKITFKLYLKHKLTAYHLRDKLNRKKASHLFLCNCGWEPWWVKKVHYQLLPRRIFCIFGHDWKEETEIHTGPVGFEESEETLLGTIKQCNRCFHCK